MIAGGAERRLADHATVETIARETAAPAHIVRALYDEETARLAAHARLKQFVPVIAIKRVKDRLRRQRDAGGSSGGLT